MKSTLCQWILLILVLLFLQAGCTSTTQTPPLLDGSKPMVRIRLMQSVDQVTLAASQPPSFTVASYQGNRTLNLSAGVQVNVSLLSNGWQIGNTNVGTGVMTIVPRYEGTVTVNGKPYRGRYRFVPVAPGRFDVVNDVDIDGYLKGVISRELYRNWNLETYKAQAIVARTYALYEARTTPPGQHWDLYDDERSQVYGGMDDETYKSREAVDATAGIVVAYGAPGHERIFKAYFSSCCGGVSQSASDAFGDPDIAPLSSQSDQGLCSAAPKYNWGPVILTKAELTRRVRLYGQRLDHPVKNIGNITRVDGEANLLGRPVRFFLFDDKNLKYMLRSEDFRRAVNTDAPDASSTIYSSFLRIVNDPVNVQFIEGHGHGHGVGMCQWAAQGRAERGIQHEDIVLAAYPKSILARAY